MRRALLILALAAITAASHAADRRYEIRGVWEGGEGQKVYLKRGGASKNDPYIDSATVRNGKFAFTDPGLGKVVDLYPQGASSGQAVIFERQPAQVSIGMQAGKPAVSVAPSPEQTLLAAYKLKKTQISFMQFGGLFAMAAVKDDPVKLDSVRKVALLAQQQIEQQFRAKLDSNANMLSSAFAIETILLPDRPAEESLQAYDKLSAQVKRSYAGQALKQRIDGMKEVNVGGIAPDIDLAAPDGTRIKLSSLRGKYVLLDFWASWCKPCLREVPNVKAIYERYRARGFEVYGVSLDDEKGRSAWIEAIRKHGMEWPQVSSLRGWDCPAAKRYMVTGIPSMFLIDPRGRIIAKNLRGEELQNKVASLFEQPEK